MSSLLENVKITAWAESQDSIKAFIHFKITTTLATAPHQISDALRAEGRRCLDDNLGPFPQELSLPPLRWEGDADDPVLLALLVEDLDRLPRRKAF